MEGKPRIRAHIEFLPTNYLIPSVITHKEYSYSLNFCWGHSRKEELAARAIARKCCRLVLWRMAAKTFMQRFWERGQQALNSVSNWRVANRPSRQLLTHRGTNSMPFTALLIILDGSGDSLGARHRAKTIDRYQWKRLLAFRVSWYVQWHCMKSFVSRNGPVPLHLSTTQLFNSC